MCFQQDVIRTYPTRRQGLCQGLGVIFFVILKEKKFVVYLHKEMFLTDNCFSVLVLFEYNEG